MASVYHVMYLCSSVLLACSSSLHNGKASKTLNSCSSLVHRLFPHANKRGQGNKTITAAPAIPTTPLLCTVHNWLHSATNAIYRSWHVQRITPFLTVECIKHNLIQAINNFRVFTNTRLHNTNHVDPLD